MTVGMTRRVATITMLLWCCAATMAQQAPAQPPQKAAPASPVNSRVEKKSAPQVVTIVHKLNGLKMFRLLLRSEQQAQALASLDSHFKLLGDVHTNVIAGVAMDDGETIAAWLPEADVELGWSGFAGPQIPVPNLPTPSTFASSGAPAPPQFNFGLFEPPDVTVIGSDGKQLLAKYVGFDAVTGLSILKLADKNPSAAGSIQDEPVDVGDNVRLLGPEPVTGQRGFLNSSLYVRIGATEGRVFDVRKAPSGGVARFKVSSARLTQSNVGGVAVNNAGETVGIVNGLEGGEATVLPATMIRRAAERVLARQSSVPKPYLGVRGEAVGAMKVDQILNHGWKPERAAALAEDDRGILLTSIVPGSPAAQAALRVGDVILKVNDQEIANSEDFTWWLDQAGPSSMVSFTVARPDRAVEEALDVKLSGRLDSGSRFNFRKKPIANAFLVEQGIETIALRASAASQLGTTAGLLVVYVEPSAPAFAAGLQPGDLIQSINGQSVSPLRPPFLSASTRPTTLTFEVVRNKQKRTVTVTNTPKRKQ
jgi:S1-C subfamily serine protease